MLRPVLLNGKLEFLQLLGMLHVAFMSGRHATLPEQGSRGCSETGLTFFLFCIAFYAETGMLVKQPWDAVLTRERVQMHPHANDCICMTRPDPAIERNITSS